MAGSTKTPPTTGTNPRVVRVSGALAPGVKVQGVTVEGLRRPQHPRPEGYAGHNTHGLTVGYVDGAQLRDLRVVGVKGSGSSPPAETFALEVWQASTSPSTTARSTARTCRPPCSAVHRTTPS